MRLRYCLVFVFLAVFFIARQSCAATPEIIVRSGSSLVINDGASLKSSRGVGSITVENGAAVLVKSGRIENGWRIRFGEGGRLDIDGGGSFVTPIKLLLLDE